MALANSLISKLTFRTYMKGEFMVYGGSYSTTSYILLEGDLVVFGMNEDYIGYLTPGVMYSNSFPEKEEMWL